MRNLAHEVLLAFTFLLCPFNGYSQEIKKVTVENETYVVNVSVESEKLIIAVKNKMTFNESEFKQTAVLVNNVQNILFISRNSFIVEGHFGVGAALLLATIMDNNTIRLDAEIRVGKYYISPSGTTLVYSNWNPIASSGATYLHAVDLRSDYRSTHNGLIALDWIKGKIIFETEDFRGTAEKELILSPYLIWADGDKRIFFLCEELRENPYNYLFEYNFDTGKSSLIAKLDKHNPRSTIQTFQWNEKEKVVEIIYSGIKAKKTYKYSISDSGELKYRELSTQSEKE
ncbi:MAG: hypothetical protein ACYC69_18070 [Thermodesulfovibrionales bacterium]